MSIIETTKSMIYDLDFPTCLWVEGCLISIYILNKCPRRVLKEKTLEEAFLGENPHATQFFLFDCLVDTHILHEKMTKLEPFSFKVIFVGYSETSKSYRLYIPSKKKEVVSIDVKFDENLWSS
jgi:hypothetical protein